MSAHRVLIIDDDRLMRNSLVDLVEAAGWTAKPLARATDAERWIAQFQPDVILSDVRMPETTGLELLARLVAAPPIVLISAHGDVPMAVEAMREGAYSFIEKPFDPKRLLLILSHAAEQHQMRQSNLRLRERLRQLSGLDRVLLGQTPQMQRVRDTIAMLADSDASVLVQGETGTGKDLVARAIHDLSDRCGGPFIAINAAQISADHLPHIARESAGGTLLLDEICTCPIDIQPNLLRLIETGEIMGPDQGRPEHVDLRIIATSNEDANEAMTQGRLRPDLFYRLNAFALSLPPLRDRRDDIGLLLQKFLQDFAAQYEGHAPELSDTEMAGFLAHDWPGNIRELRNAAERQIMLARHGLSPMADGPGGAAADPWTGKGLREAVAAFERQMIGKAIQSHAGRMDDAAEELGIGRRTLNEKIVKLGLDKDALL